MKNEMQQVVHLPAIISQTADNGSFTSIVIDTRGFDYAEFVTFISAADVSLTVFKIMASDVKANSTTLGGTPEEIINFDDKPGSGDAGKIWVGGVDLVNRKVPRYLQIQATAGDGASGVTMSSMCSLGGNKVSGSSKEDRRVEFVQYNQPTVT